MRLRRASDRLSARRAGRYALLCALAAVTGVVVGWSQVLQRVVVALNDMVDRVGAGPAAEVARGAVDGEDQGPHRGLPAGREPAATVRALPTAGWHGDPPSWMPWQDLLGRKVTVTLSQEPLVEQRGILLAVSDHGQVVVRDEADGEVHWCWPALEIRPGTPADRLDMAAARQVDSVGNILSGLNEHGLAAKLWAIAEDLQEKARRNRP